MKYPNIHKLKFTLSFSPEMKSSGYLQKDTLDLLKQNAEKIHDVNFTCQIPPFLIDAHGVVMNQTETKMHLRDMLDFQEYTGIRVSALFNNIYVPPTIENLKRFIKSFQEIYEAGVRSVTIPHTIWMISGHLKDAFPDLTIKNTVLRHCLSAQDFWNFAEAGFDYVNINRVLKRDYRELKKIRQAQKKFHDMTGKYVRLSMLDLEACLGYCSVWAEHYQYTLMHPESRDHEKNKEICGLPMRFGCQRKLFATIGARVGMSPFKDDWEEISQYFDIVKFPGRKHLPDIIGVLKNIRHLLDDSVDVLEYSSRTYLSMSPDAIKQKAADDPIINRWRKTIKNCRYQCWDCDLCKDITSDKLHESMTPKRKSGKKPAKLKQFLGNVKNGLKN